MAKKNETAKTANTTKKAKAPGTKSTPATTIRMPFGQWVKEVARARGEIGATVLALREEKGLTVKTPLKSALEKFPKAAALEGRYNGFLKRGHQTKANQTKKAA